MTQHKPLDRNHWQLKMADICRDTYNMRQNKRMPYKTGMFKSYLVEAYEDREQLDDIALKDLIKGIVKSIYPQDKPIIEQSDERFFHVILEKQPFVFDCKESRFWRIETDIVSKDSDAILKKLVTNGQWLDQLWLPSSLQISIPRKLGAEIRALSTGFGLDKEKDDDDFSFEKDGESSELFDKHSIRISSTKTLEMYEALKKVSSFSRHVAITRTETRWENNGLIALSSVWFQGKITSRGTWFEGLQGIISRTIELYRMGIGSVDECRIGIWEKQVKGKPIFIEFSSNSSFRADLFESIIDHYSKFFKLIITWREDVSDDCSVFDMVDRHTGDSFTLVFRNSDTDLVRLELSISSRSCSNLVPRLLTNIQHYVDATASCALFENPILTEED